MSNVLTSTFGAALACLYLGMSFYETATVDYDNRAAFYFNNVCTMPTKAAYGKL